MGDQAQLLPGTLDLLILRAVSLGPLHGYGIFLRIGQISGNALVDRTGRALSWPVSPGAPGAVEGEWGTSENNRRAKFYELTAAGRKRLREETDNWNRLVDRDRRRALRTTGGSMRLLDSLRFHLPPFSTVHGSTSKWKRNCVRTSRTVRMTSHAMAFHSRKPNAAPASSSVARSASVRNAMKPRVELF